MIAVRYNIFKNKGSPIMKLAKILLLSLALSSAAVHAVKYNATKDSVTGDNPSLLSTSSSRVNTSAAFDTAAIKRMFSKEPTEYEDAKARLGLKARTSVLNLELQDFVIRSTGKKPIMTPEDCIVEALECLSKIAQDSSNSNAGGAFDEVFNLWHKNQDDSAYEDFSFGILKELIHSIGHDRTHPRYEKMMMLRASQVFQIYTPEYTEVSRNSSDVFALRNIAWDVTHVDAYFAANSLRHISGYEEEALACMQILMSSNNPNADLAQYAWDKIDSSHKKADLAKYVWHTESFKHAMKQFHAAKVLCDNPTVEDSLNVVEDGRVLTPGQQLIEALSALKDIALDSSNPDAGKALYEIFTLWNTNQVNAAYEVQYDGTFINGPRKVLADLIRNFSGDERHPDYGFINRLRLIPALTEVN